MYHRPSVSPMVVYMKPGFVPMRRRYRDVRKYLIFGILLSFCGALLVFQRHIGPKGNVARQRQSCLELASLQSNSNVKIRDLLNLAVDCATYKGFKVQAQDDAVYEFPVAAIKEVEKIWNGIAPNLNPEGQEVYTKKNAYHPSCTTHWDACFKLPDETHYLDFEIRNKLQIPNPSICGRFENKTRLPIYEGFEDLAVHGRSRVIDRYDAHVDGGSANINGSRFTLQSRGVHYYPPGSFREWHTNAYDRHGWRMYMVKVTEDEKSFFAWKSPIDGSYKKMSDKNAHVRFFRLSNRPILWHSIYSYIHRWSIGLFVPEEALRQILINFAIEARSQV